MSSTRITEKLSKLVRSQLPEFIQSDYETFVLFLEYYYEYLEQDQHAQELIQNARSYADIDRTAEGFVQYFIQQFGSKLPKNLLVNRPLLLKRLNDLYEAKGSDLSYKLLFRILFDTTVTSRKPYDNVLRASAGKWEQVRSIRVRLVSGSVDDILNRTLVLEKSGIPFYAAITRIKTLSSDLYELFLEYHVAPPFELDDVVYVNSGTSTIFTGTVDPTPTTYNIIRAGRGFKVGQIFNVNFEGAVGTVVQVSDIDEDGGITRLRFINYGYNFPAENITIELRNDLVFASRTIRPRTITNSLTDQFQALLVHTGLDPNRYFESDYVEFGYTGDILFETSADPGIEGGTTVTFATNEPSVALVDFSMGATGLYPGHYITNDGFLSEPEVRLQDDMLYQPYAYLLETDIDISKFYEIVKTLIHPAGTRLFNNRIVQSEVSVKSRVSVITQSNIFTELYSVFSTEDIKTLQLNRTIEDSVDVPTSNTWALFKPVFESITETDTNYLNVIKSVSDSAGLADTISTISVGLQKTDDQTTEDIIAKALSVAINNTDSTVSITENLTALLGTSDYAEVGYFAELYVGVLTPII